MDRVFPASRPEVTGCSATFPASSTRPSANLNLMSDSDTAGYPGSEWSRRDCWIASATIVDEHMTVAPESNTTHPMVSSSPFTSSTSCGGCDWELDAKPSSLARHSANSFAHGDMSNTTLAESVALERLAVCGFVQFWLR